VTAERNGNHNTSSLVAEVEFLSYLPPTAFLAYLSFIGALFWQVRCVSRLKLCLGEYVTLTHIQFHTSKVEYKTSSHSPSCPITQNLSHKHIMALNITSRNRYIITNSQTGTVMDLSGSDSKSGMLSPHIRKCTNNEINMTPRYSHRMDSTWRREPAGTIVLHINQVLFANIL